jgi:thiol-disulfide isomerase/thioredoxin
MMTARNIMLAGFAGLAVVGGLAAFYLQAGGAGNPAACPVTSKALSAASAQARGEVAAFLVAKEPRKLGTLAFNGPDGQKTTLASFAGKTVLLNLWATWCAPCRKEMPALDAVQAEMGGADFTVVAVNIDTRNLDKPQAWLKENGIARLGYYADPEAKIFQDLKREGLALGMPTTLIIGPDGCHAGVLHGAAEWASADAKALIRTVMAK